MRSSGLRDSFRLPSGRIHVGGWQPSALEFPASGEPTGEQARQVIAAFVLNVGIIRLLAGWFIRAGSQYTGEAWPLIAWQWFHLVFVVCFCVHCSCRYTLMQPGKRAWALVLSLIVGIPLAYLLPWYAAAICLFLPRTYWRMLISWLTYPNVHAPGLFRSPIRPQGLRLALSISFDLPTAFLAMFFAIPALETDDDTALQIR